jgi:hypothetical protein
LAITIPMKRKKQHPHLVAEKERPGNMMLEIIAIAMIRN